MAISAFLPLLLPPPTRRRNGRSVHLGDADINEIWHTLDDRCQPTRNAAPKRTLIGGSMVRFGPLAGFLSSPFSDDRSSWVPHSGPPRWYSRGLPIRGEVGSTLSSGGHDTEFLANSVSCPPNSRTSGNGGGTIFLQATVWLAGNGVFDCAILKQLLYIEMQVA